MITTKDIAWLAGLLEGEGSFSLHVTTKRYPDYRLPVVQVGMTDEDVIARAAQLLGCKYRKRITKHKPIYIAILTGKRAAAWMMTLYPLMGERRQERIREVLDAWKSQQTRGQVNRKRWIDKTPEERRVWHERMKAARWDTKTPEERAELVERVRSARWGARARHNDQSVAAPQAA